MKTHRTFKDIDPSNLVALSDAEIQAIAEEISFDLAICEKRLFKGDAWQHIVYGHLFFDHVITSIIEENVFNPEPLQLDRMAFAAKSALVEALGLVDIELLSFSKNLNSLRNKLAHRIAFRLRPEHVRKLASSSRADVNASAADFREENGGSKLSNLILFNLFAIELRRQELVLARLRNKRRGVAAGQTAKSIHEILRMSQ